MEVASEVLERYVGDYEPNAEPTATFELVDGVLHTRLTDQPAFPLFAASEPVFFLRVAEAEVEFELDETAHGHRHDSVPVGADTAGTEDPRPDVRHTRPGTPLDRAREPPCVGVRYSL